MVVPAFNAETTIASTLRSVQAQTRAPQEIVVVDDGSTDGTRAAVLELARDDARITALSQENRGLPAARNAGIRAARGELVSFLDADDLWMPDYVATIDRLLADRPHAGIAYGDAWVLDDGTKRVLRRTAAASYDAPEPAPAKPEDFLRELVERNFIFVSVTVPREILLELGGFDESLSAAEDWEMWLRIAAAGHTGAGTRKPVAIYRRHTGQMSADLSRMLHARREVYGHIAERHPVPDDVRARARALQAELEGLAPPPAGGWKRTPAAAPLRHVVRLARRERDYHRRPPRPVRAAFPDLASR